MGFLVLAILSSSMISIMMRIGSDRASGKMSMLAANYLACSLLGAAYAGFRLAAPQEAGFSVTLWLGLISGVLYLAGLVAFQRNTGKHGIVLSSVFMKLGLLVPIVMSIILFGEVPGVLQIVGFVIAVAAIVLINWSSNRTDMRMGAGLVILLLAGGAGDAMSKVFEV
jgi:drug/metabolite transporter (DMT)-like permease